MGTYTSRTRDLNSEDLRELTSQARYLGSGGPRGTWVKDIQHFRVYRSRTMHVAPLPASQEPEFESEGRPLRAHGSIHNDLEPPTNLVAGYLAPIDQFIVPRGNPFFAWVAGRFK